MKSFVSPFRRFIQRAIIVLSLFGIAEMGWGQASLTTIGQPYIENFNSLTTATFNLTNNTSIAGVYSLRASGNATPNVFTADNGGSNAGRFNNYGSTSSVDRALGSASSGTPGTLQYGIRFKNNTGVAISSLTITYTGEQWRNGGNTSSQPLSFDYRQAGTITDLTGTYTSVSELTFNTPTNTATAAAIDGNNATNRVVLTAIVSVTIPVGEEIMLRWTDINDTGNDHGVSIDDLSVTPSAAASNISNVLLNSSFSHPTNIDYSQYQTSSSLTTGNSIEVGQFVIQDGGGSPDADALSTTLTACSFAVENSANIRALALFDGSTNIGEITTVGATSSFSNLTLSAADAGNKSFSLRATFKSSVTDNHQISFAVTSATASTSGSGFAAANAGGAITSTLGDNNRIEVVTTDIIFDQNVSTVAQNAVMSPSPTVRAVDANANFDLDNTSSVVITISAGSTTFSTATTTIAMVAGVATFNNLIFSTAANSNNLTATQGAYSDISSTFNVTASAPEINVKQGATSLTSGIGLYTASNQISGTSGSAITFTIENLGSANLTYSSITSSNTTDFTLNTSAASSPIAASGTTTFTITFNPNTSGAKSTTITINNNDADEGTYTFNVTGTGTVSTASNIVSIGDYLYSSNVDYAGFQSASSLTSSNSAGVAGFTIQDGAGAADADNLGTTLTAISFTTGSSTAIRTAALFDGSTNVSEVAVGGSTTFSFSGLTLSAADASTKNFELRVTYQESVTDNQQITFTVSSATASATHSGFAAANAGAAASAATGDINRLEVTASALAFVQQPSNVSVNTAMTPAPAVSANDGNGNRDLDYVTNMTATTTGNFDSGSTNTITPIAGLGSFNNLQLSAAAVARTLAVGSGSLANTANSNLFNVFEAQPTIQSSAIGFTNIGMNSMTINWTNGNGANRMVVVKASGAPGIPSDGQSYIANTVLGSGSTFGSSEYVVYKGTGTSVNISNLVGSTIYSVKVFEFNGNNGTENYLTTSNNTSQATAGLVFYSNGSGDPAAIANWRTERNGTGTSPTNFTSGETFVIENGDNMTTTTTWSISGTNSKLQIEDGGTLIANNAITLAATTTFQIDNGGIYIHNNTVAFASTIFAGTENFASNSIVEFRDWNTTGPSIAVFGNLKVNPLGQPGSALQLGSVTTTINGNLEVLASGTTTVRDLRLSSSSALSLTIAGNLIVSGTGSLDIASSTGTTVDRIVNIGGNFVQTGGTVKCTGNLNAALIKFTGSGKTFTQSAGTLTNSNINWAIADGASLTLVNSLPVATNRSLTVGDGISGVLNCSSSSVSGLGSFTISTGATLKTSHTGGLTSAIAVTGTKTFSAGANYVFSGNTTTPFPASPQSIGNPASVTIDAAITLNRDLETTGLTINSTRTLILPSTADLTISGNIVNNGTLTIADGGSLVQEGNTANSGSGTYTAQKSLTGSGLTTPTGRFWYTGVPMSGATAGGFSAQGPNNKLWSHSEATGAYTEIDNNDEPIVQGKGYVFRGSSTGTYSFSSNNIGNGNFTYTLTRLGTTKPGFNLISNPYPSHLSWDQLYNSTVTVAGADNTSPLLPTIWYRTATSGGTMLFDTYNATIGVGTNNSGTSGNGTQVTGTIAPFQSVWVRVQNGVTSTTMTATNAMRSHGTQSTLNLTPATVRLNISNGLLHDETLVVLNEDLSNAYDNNDSSKEIPSATIHQLYSLEGSTRVAINGIANALSKDTLQLGVQIPTAGNYSINCTEHTFSDLVYLEDKITDAYIELNSTTTYSFTSEAGTFNNRFVLHFAPVPALPGQTAATAIAMPTSNWPQCNNVTSEDAWHAFTATTEGISIEVNTASADVVIELQDGTGNVVAQENAVNGIGNETLNFYGLIAGQTYKVGVHNNNTSQPTGTYGICVKSLKRGGCDYGAGPYSLCQYYKATWAGSTGVSYTFTFTGTSGPATGQTFTRTQSSDICVLSTVTPLLPYGSTYSVVISNTYTLTDGAGNTEQITVPSNSACQVITIAEPQTTLNANNSCNNGPRFRGSVVSSAPWVCGASNWRWRFTEVNPLTLQAVGLPIELNRGAASNFLSLGTVNQLQSGKTYAVRTAPVFNYTGTNYNWGPTQYMCIVGSAGMTLEGADAEQGVAQGQHKDALQIVSMVYVTEGNHVNIQLSNTATNTATNRAKRADIYDVTGKCVKSIRLVEGMNQVELSEASGIYMVRTTVGNQTETHRVFIQK